MHFIRALLAFGDSRADFVPDRLADFFAAAIGRNHVGRSVCAFESDFIFTGANTRSFQSR